MQRMLSEPGAIFFEFDLRRTAEDLEFGPIIQIARFRALQPDHFAV
jgi:hypothetical protein